MARGSPDEGVNPLSRNQTSDSQEEASCEETVGRRKVKTQEGRRKVKPEVIGGRRKVKATGMICVRRCHVVRSQT
jgi:hypothetical protein